MSLNARLIEKNIFASVDEADAGDSDIIDLFGWEGGSSRLSIQSIYTVDTPVGASVGYYGSNNGTDWTLLQAATAISANGSSLYSITRTTFRYFKATKALSSGTVDLKGYLLVIGNNI